MNNGMAIWERCGQKPAEIILKIGMHVRQDGKAAYAPDRHLCLECEKIKHWQEPKHKVESLEKH